MSDIILCKNCGEKTNKLYCKDCSTKAGREEFTKQTLAIARENLAKGLNIPEPYKTRLKNDCSA